MRSITVLMITTLSVFFVFLFLTVKALPYTDKVEVDTKLVSCEERSGWRGESDYVCLFDGKDYAKEINVSKLQYQYFSSNKDKEYSVKVRHPRFNWFIASLIFTFIFAICFTMIAYARHTEEEESPYHD